MKNWTRLMVCSSAAAACIALFPAGVLAQASAPAKDAAKDAKQIGKDMAKDAKDAGKKEMEKHPADKPGAGPDMNDEMMKKMMEQGAPGKNHEYLKQWAGEWDLKVMSYMAPGAPPEESKCTASSKLIMGGRYLVEDVKGAFDMHDGKPPQAFEGRSLMGYDNFKKKYFSQWIDNFGTGCMTEEGTCDAAGKVMTTSGENFDPMVGSMQKSRSVATIVDANTRKLEMFGPGPDGKEVKKMEITYTRKK